MVWQGPPNFTHWIIQDVALGLYRYFTAWPLGQRTNYPFATLYVDTAWRYQSIHTVPEYLLAIINLPVLEYCTLISGNMDFVYFLSLLYNKYKSLLKFYFKQFCPKRWDTFCSRTKKNTWGIIPHLAGRYWTLGYRYRWVPVI